MSASEVPPPVVVHKFPLLKIVGGTLVGIFVVLPSAVLLLGFLVYGISLVVPSRESPPAQVAQSDQAPRVEQNDPQKDNTFRDYVGPERFRAAAWGGWDMLISTCDFVHAPWLSHISLRWVDPSKDHRRKYGWRGEVQVRADFERGDSAIFTLGSGPLGNSTPGMLLQSDAAHAVCRTDAQFVRNVVFYHIADKAGFGLN